MSQSNFREAVEPPRYQPRRLGHINLFVNNFDEMCAFLHDVCGFEQTGIMPGIGSGFFSNGNTHHDIGFVEHEGYKRVRAKNPDPNDPPGRGSSPGLNHFGWEMANEAELVEAYHRAKNYGLEPRITSNGTAYSNYLFDVDGVQHQFYADNVKEWRTAYTGGVVDLHRKPNWVPGEKPASTEAMYETDPEIRRVENACLNPVCVTHAALVSDNFEKTLSFYVDVAGLNPVHRSADGACVYLKGQASRYDIVLVDAKAVDCPAGLHHASFELFPDQDFDEAIQKLKDANVEIARTLDLDHKKSIFVKNPDGLLLEFYIWKGDKLGAIESASRADRAFVV